MALTAMLYVDGDADERRAAPRRLVGQETTLRQSGHAAHAVLHDLSSTGASVETSTPLAPGSTLTVGLAGVGRFPATVVSVSGSRFGCRFDHPLTQEALRKAFASDPVVVGSFVAPSDRAARPAAEQKYPGFVRLALPIGGAIAGWTLIVRVVAGLVG